MTSKRQSRDACACGSGKSRAACCGRFLSREQIPSTPEELMRSRYSAFAEGDGAWIRDTWAPETRPADAENLPAVRWLGLKVIASELSDADHGTVEFVARGRAGPHGAFRMHELSRFERREGRWLYVDGEDPDDKKDS